MNLSAAARTTPSPQLLDALPALRRVEEELAATLTPAMTKPEPVDGYDGYAHAAWIASKLLHFLLRAAAATDPAERQACLIEVEADAVGILRAAHRARAAISTVQELGAAEAELRMLDLDDTILVERAELAVALPTGAFADTAVPVTIRMDNQDQVAIHSSHARLGPADGCTQLGVAAALRLLGEALTGCWQPEEA